MAESKKETSSSVKSKDNDSLLDLDIGKDFLSSWKSMNEDPMDFDFGSVSKGKKNKFKFDNMDMDFNIDGDFGNIPSFNIDMPDLGISSPLKKDAKTKDKSNKDPATGDNKGKADGFDFSFGFDELNGFDFRSSPRKEDIKAKRVEEKENSPNRIRSQYSGDRPAEDSGDTGPCEDVIFRMPKSEALITENLHTQVDAGSSPSPIEKFPSNLVQNDKVLSYSKEADDVQSHDAVTSLEKTMPTKEQQSDRLLDKSKFSASISEEGSIAVEAIQDAEAHSTFRDKSTEDTVSELQEEVGSGDIRHIESSEKDNGQSQVLAGKEAETVLGESIPNKKGNVTNEISVELSTELLSSGFGQIMPSPTEGRTVSNHLMPGKQREAFVTRSKYFKQPDKTEELSQSASNQMIFSSLSEEVIGSGPPRGTDESCSRKGNVEETQSDGKLTDISVSNSGVPVGKQHLKFGSQEHTKDLTLNRPLDQDIFKRKPASGGTHLRNFFNQRDKTEELSKKAPNQTRLSSLSEGVIGSGQPHGTDERKGNAEETQSDGKFTDISLSNSGVPVSKQHLKVGSQEHAKDLTLNRPLDQGILKRKPASEGSFKNVKSLDSVRLTRQTDKSTLQSPVNSGNLVPDMPILQTIKNSTHEGYKSYSSKAIGKMPALSSLKISRSGGNLDSSKVIPQKERSTKNLDQNRIFLAGSRNSETAQFVEAKKQTPPTHSLKRKMVETPNADAVLKPSKRLSESPSNRNSVQTSMDIVDNEAFNKSPAVQDNSQNSKLYIPGELSLKELEVPFLLENDSNVEKAESYTKELEDICNMLRKKHEEAKEILVRAIVNNNKLLMLNHPLHEEKICMVQNFALQLTLRE